MKNNRTHRGSHENFPGCPARKIKAQRVCPKFTLKGVFDLKTNQPVKGYFSEKARDWEKAIGRLVCYGYAEAIDFQLHVAESCIIGDIHYSGHCIGEKLRVHYGYHRQKVVLHYGCYVALLGLKRGTNIT